MRAGTKAVLKTKLQVEQSSRIQGVQSAVVIDGCAMLWSVQWHTSGPVGDYIINLMGDNQVSPGTQICSGYIGNSTQQIARYSRSSDNDASRKHQLSLHTTLPIQNVTLNVMHNRVQLIRLICHYMINRINDNLSKLVTTVKNQ